MNDQKDGSINLDDDLVVVSGKGSTHKEEFEVKADQARQASGHTSDDFYAKFTKLIYLIDVSGSMASGMAPEDPSLLYLWPPEKLEEFRAAIKSKMADGTELGDRLKVIDVGEPEMVEDDDGNEIEVPHTMNWMDDEALKEVILKEGLHHHLSIQLDANLGLRRNDTSKLGIVKENAKKFVTQMFQKYGQAYVQIFAFDDKAKQKTIGTNTLENILHAVDELYLGGSTDIYAAVLKAIEECEKRPSKIGVHHIVLISDGLDLGAMTVMHLVEQMKKLNITFDFIYISGGESTPSNYDMVPATLSKVCKATGGEFTDVAKASDFSKKFFQVSSRLCLPPARG